MIEDMGEMVTLSDGHSVKIEDLAEFHRKRQEDETKRLQAARERVAVSPRTICPFKSGASSTCSGDACALFIGTGCALHCLGAQDATEATASSTKRKCPFMGRTCGKLCSLYTGAGCAIVEFASNL